MRLIAPLESRIRRAEDMHRTGRDLAENFVRANDHARERFVRTNCNQDIGDPHAYDLVSNTDRIPTATAAQLVLQALQARAAAPDHAGSTRS